MRFARFGVTLERLERRHLDVVRQWRNSAWVRPYMRYQAMVGSEDQIRWFDSLDSSRDWYFCGYINTSAFGLFHVKAVDWSQKYGEAGAFVGDPGFIGRPEPAQATLALMDFAFLLLNLDSLEAQYRASLPKVVRFNEQLGYAAFREDADGFVRARVTRERYFERADMFRQAAASLHGTIAALSTPDAWLAHHIERRPVQQPADFDLRL